LSSQPQAEPAPRIAPGTRRQVGAVNAAILWVLGRVSGAKSPPNVMTTLARHRRLFRGWLRFAATMMPRGTLKRADTELVILRVAHNCDCTYEWGHHALIAEAAGLSREDVERVRQGPESAGWTPHQASLLRAVDELHGERQISDAAWTELSSFLSETELIELCMLTGHYEMLAMTLNALRVAPDDGDSAPSLPARRGRR
jgi:alkylhydroperoxidase family enzyme